MKRRRFERRAGAVDQTLQDTQGENLLCFHAGTGDTLVRPKDLQCTKMCVWLNDGFPEHIHRFPIVLPAEKFLGWLQGSVKWRNTEKQFHDPFTTLM